MNQFLWIPGRGIDPAALARLRAHCRKPHEFMGEAWFMGERRLFPELLGDLGTLSIGALQLALEEIASGTSSFGPQQEWRDWYHYLLGDLLPRSHGFDVYSLLEYLMTGFMTQYPNGVHQSPYPEFHEDALLTLGRCLMEPACWHGQDIALGQVLRRSNDNPAGVWMWFDASGDLSASLFFCLKYLPESAITPWLHSVLAIPAPHWRAQLLVWLTGVHDILSGALAWPAQLSLDARPYVGWEWSHCLGPHLAQADESGALPGETFLPQASRQRALHTLRAYFTEERYRQWRAAITAVPELESELEGIRPPLRNGICAHDGRRALYCPPRYPLRQMNCRDHCGACCTAPSITSPLPGMPNGKPAGVRCVQLDDDNRCRVFGKPERPAFCGGLQPSVEMCGENREQAIRWLDELERATAPD